MLDDKDKKLLKLMQADGRMTAKDASEQLDMSVPATAERIKKLVEAGYIHDFRAVVDSKKIGYDVTAFILVVMSSSDYYEELVRHAKESDEILECHSITGEGSHILKVRLHDTSELEGMLRKIQSWVGVIRTHTMIVMTTFKEETRLAIE
ncbi:MAG: Lrp/AsnC family transcriptional regulator [Candidatus Marinimicrobia bacterium]|jgi:Lrp/AsnC family leucine-responsive transcriptional regulator|nr:Lrp/AsnC family transcriptional regulator [Candidatus Neomarinimicrobiota bacterium]MDP6568873.1 Lrp/AsnC family transcriptional regulator [Candidatus Neomarinimicrobiota bacterium]MDP7025923.1 Lrp/AsnC family transcriptional regulator [Candidatus Neomarinimicrobiota bacterium]MDP7558476.1 Lrp/AsnC family transcriptional regulator [Candidatus Neomarinimicrobiota bacterium]MDP7653367.1 Lrp/AsnC family transcriptional regulator [Candidatus Neomarinimicrobiota bacterium]|tara:strand:- start:354 stop:803 length:450 start_codon:yes stop_codon:yes gene_type:complete